MYICTSTNVQDVTSGRAFNIVISAAIVNITIMVYISYYCIYGIY